MKTDLYFAVILYLLIVGCQSPPKEVLKPNVILIISDDQGWADYGFMHHPSIRTPNLDRLAQESLCFTRGYATAPLCSPSLATLITGLYAHQHGITGNDPTFSFEGDRYSTEWMLTRKPYFDTLKTNFYRNKLLTEFLGEAGYQSLQTGKWWLGSWQEGHFDQGMTHGDPNMGGRHGDEGLKIGREGQQNIYDFITDSKAKNLPYFIWYAPFLPHTPHNPPEEILEKYVEETDSEPTAKYWAMCEWFDQLCGELIDFTRMNDAKRETVIIYTTDNGWVQDPDKNGYAERSKRSPYEMGIRTPLMVHWPGVVSPRFDSTTLVSNIDIVPTILSIAGILPAGFPGLNLIAPSGIRADRIVYAEAFEHDITDVKMPTQSLQYRVAIQYPWKLIMPDTSTIVNGQIELFNVAKDPYELNNQASQHNQVVGELQTALNAWWSP